jgi:hypothetical protein
MTDDRIPDAELEGRAEVIGMCVQLEAEAAHARPPDSVSAFLPKRRAPAACGTCRFTDQAVSTSTRVRAHATDADRSPVKVRCLILQAPTP